MASAWSAHHVFLLAVGGLLAVNGWQKPGMQGAATAAALVPTLAGWMCVNQLFTRVLYIGMVRRDGTDVRA